MLSERWFNLLRGGLGGVVGGFVGFGLVATAVVALVPRWVTLLWAFPVIGTIMGLLCGPPTGLLRLSWRRAALLWAAAIVLIGVGVSFMLVVQGPQLRNPRIWIGLAVIHTLFALGGAAAGICCEWVLRRFLGVEPAGGSPPVQQEPEREPEREPPRKAARSLDAGAEGA